MRRLAGLMAAAIGFAAAAGDGGNRAAAEVTQMEDLGEDIGSLSFEGGEGCRQGTPPCPNVSQRKDQPRKKKNPANPHIHVAHPTETVLFCCLTKLCSHTVIYGSQKEDGWTQPGHGWKSPEGTMIQVLGVGTGRRMAQPEADRRPLRLRAMPPGRLRRKRQNPYPTGRHNDRAGRCGRVCRLRGAVVGGTGGQRASMTLSPRKIAQPFRP